ncbi:NADPH:quinone reductase [Actinophytocola xinjiangensis]|uniref:NADPH:quinone reductase n=1 Tax=Actinophytocola xinjiangensis TaxID=485602 RepID=A0A7Z0WM13_9PSEU|nr:zinc-binding dehydrogenase [Actinophytocola xinjiangensis]OLF08098.1 NADPH:quinone reductase [Actinophytocola xinjiangensis]
MRAVWLTKFGSPEVLVARDSPEPVVGPGQALVDVTFGNITFVETQVRAGNGPYRPELPMILGNGVGGVVRAAEDPKLVGATVVTSTGGSGGYAERVAVDAAGLFVVPRGLALDDAVALLADGRTATMLTDAAGLRRGDRVLVEAAAGGVGGLLVQLARAAGAYVIAAAGGARKVAVALDRGADLAVDYLRPGWTDQVGEVDVVFDGVGGDIGRAAFGALRVGGRLVVYGLASGTWNDVTVDEASARGVTLVRPSPAPAELRGFTEAALADGAAGRLRPLIGQRFPLSAAADAHAAIEARVTVGKTLLETSPVVGHRGS